jgi:hypothetical protein
VSAESAEKKRQKDGGENIKRGDFFACRLLFGQPRNRENERQRNDFK